MPSQEILSEILETFRSEGADLLKAIRDQLLIIEQAADREAREAPLEIACRSAHTLKGGALMLDLLSIKSLVHAVEDLLVAMRQGTVKPIPEVVALILSTLDRVAEIVQLSNPESYELSDVDNELMSRLGKTLVARDRVTVKIEQPHVSHLATVDNRK